MAALFNSKHFNPEVFQQYVESIPDVTLNKLIGSGALRERPDLQQALADGTGGNYISTPLLGLIGGDPVNYDGSTDITSSSTNTFLISRIVVGRANGWTEKDFSYDITGGVDFMGNVARQVKNYWTKYDQKTVLNILAGVFAMTDTEGAKFVAAHTNDVTEVANSNNVTGHLDATTVNNTMQKALGDNKDRFSLVIMHSVVATHLENMQLLDYFKYNDANGMERRTNLATLNGRLVLVDDTMPTGTKEVGTGNDKKTLTTYTTYVLGDGAIEYTDCGVKVPYEMSRDPKTNGGEDTLYSRQRKSFCPYGINFTKASMAKPSPTDAELKNGTNWKLVNSGETTPEYINHKLIPIARVISLG